MVYISVNYPFIPIIFRYCKETEYFTEIQSPFIGISINYGLLNTNYMLVISNRSLGWLLFF
ncbi:hypothetical protein F2Y25_16790 [Bacteroides caccae]|uniref:Uncharacterized protein n=1 Tax=Bacteroides caccae TaxID=47678 RepID=A0A6A1JSZ1_9BACE|nr:hypothetical protein F2Y27_14725 [Bacteroides caccae]KAA5486639.1 hypothetical protein F2Y25_16790 [Bacteroides caccae]KAA5489263.1 hypothetical protein F2Y35_16280 [Bacteroides caccae]KAA5501284.1 hypothetical protein F2Y47_15470 [Bacteroides caccae]